MERCAGKSAIAGVYMPSEYISHFCDCKMNLMKVLASGRDAICGNTFITNMIIFFIKSEMVLMECEIMRKKQGIIQIQISIHIQGVCALKMVKLL